MPDHGFIAIYEKAMIAVSQRDWSFWTFQPGSFVYIKCDPMIAPFKDLHAYKLMDVDWCNDYDRDVVRVAATYREIIVPDDDDAILEQPTFREIVQMSEKDKWILIEERPVSQL